jgi:hypothetical protein
MEGISFVVSPLRSLLVAHASSHNRQHWNPLVWILYYGQRNVLPKYYRHMQQSKILPLHLDAIDAPVLATLTAKGK